MLRHLYLKRSEHDLLEVATQVRVERDQQVFVERLEERLLEDVKLEVVAAQQNLWRGRRKCVSGGRSSGWEQRRKRTG